jgi:hypothetical protein
VHAALKANFTLTLEHPATLHALSNMPVAATEQRPGGRTVRRCSLL